MSSIIVNIKSCERGCSPGWDVRCCCELNCDYGRFMELKASIYKMNNKTESEPESIQSISDTIS